MLDQKCPECGGVDVHQTRLRPEDSFLRKLRWKIGEVVDDHSQWIEFEIRENIMVGAKAEGVALNSLRRECLSDLASIP